jgi:hypothetical protein
MVQIKLVVTALAAYLGWVTATPTPAAGLPDVQIGKRGPVQQKPGKGSSFWYANMDHTNRRIRGFAPDLDGDLNYEVFKAVKPGDGAGIQAAINSATNGSTRHGQWFASQPRVRSAKLTARRTQR